MSRYAMRDRISALDPETDYEEIARLLVAHEFPWDTVQALSFALFRTYAVPSIGDLLYDTAELTKRTQKRYDDTVLILDAVVEHGMASEEGRMAVRRMNQMHGSYDISNADFLYVLATFVVMPVQWINSYGWRKLTDVETDGITNYYRALGKRMNIKGIPETYAEFSALLDSYEAANFAYTEKTRAVADGTLNLLTELPPNKYAPKALVRWFSFGLMDDRLADAFHYPRPSAFAKTVAVAALRLRSGFVRLLPPRKQPYYSRQMPSVQSYPNGFQVAQLGTFPSCPVRHQDVEKLESEQAV
ncbi:MAG: oxygenase MpaB family protein [Segniliparus sp.]|uniref:oxygenase MpaB family protein n=1 Tax=Segniliparus sp. TaxID=2804064 RepID=UPI003F35D3B3